MIPFVAGAQEVFRTVDETGTVIYSDRPRDEASERIVIRTARAQPAAPRAAGNANNTSNAGNDDDATTAQQPGAMIPREATPDEIAEDRRRNCQLAQERNAAYSTAHRLFRTNAAGEREYLSDAELTEARNKAQSDVATWCD
ncbi:MAG: DUF4124 domain-containing protein [Gammaproteobacteria bacterium]|nr:DUF4124 domain-containing protein [Gammaproteobacteria bacterium]